jgi:hypothetical protein
MRKSLIALIAVVSLAFAGVLFAAPKAGHNGHNASAASGGIDIFSITRNARNLPDQSYPAH